MSKENNIIISIGSNFEPQENIEFAKKKLYVILGEETIFSKSIWTDPIGMVSEKFINCLCFSKTSHTLPQLQKALKQIEKQRFRSRKNDLQNRITLDIDILQYGDSKYHLSDWDRDYVKKLYADYNDMGEDSIIIDPTLK